MSEAIGLRVVRFKTRETEKSGVKELMMVGKSLRIVNDGQYVISAQECQLLKEKGIEYTIEKRL